MRPADFGTTNAPQRDGARCDQTTGRRGRRHPDSARYREAVPNAAPTLRPRLLTAGLVLFGLGLLGILAVFLARPVADVNPPLALYLLGMLLPVGLFLAVFSAFRDGRRVR